MDKYIITILFIILSSCAVNPTIQNNDLIYDNCRILKAIVVYDDGFDKEDIEKIIIDTSKWWKNNFNISISIIEYIKYDWSNFHNYIDLIREEILITKDKDFDITIGFYSRNLFESVMDNVFGWKAVIDDKWRRFIILKSIDWYDLTHELIHGFMLSHDHDWYGIMFPNQFGFSFTPFFLRSDYVSEGLRNEIINNKWRDFSITVDKGLDIP